MTRKLAQFNDWTSDEIQTRSVSLSKMASVIWSLPEKYNRIKQGEVSQSGKVVSLDDDLDVFVGSKPASVMFMNEVIEVNSWNEVYLELHSRLFRLSPDSYYDFMMTEDNIKEQIISPDASEFSKSYKLGNGIYLNVSIRNVKRMIRKIKLFLDYYSEHDNNSFSDISDELVIELA